MNKNSKPRNHTDRYVLFYKDADWRFFQTIRFSSPDQLLHFIASLRRFHEHGSYRWFSLSASHMEASFEW